MISKIYNPPNIFSKCVFVKHHYFDEKERWVRVTLENAAFDFHLC